MKSPQAKMHMRNNATPPHTEATVPGKGRADADSFPLQQRPQAMHFQNQVSWSNLPLGTYLG